MGENGRIHFGETTRGRGRIFVHLVGTGLPADVRLRAEASAKDGRWLPASVMRVPGVDGWVLMLAVLALTQHVTITAFDAAGRELACSRKTIAALAARLHSKANTARRNPVAERIRNADVGVRPDEIKVAVDELVINSVAGCDMLRGSVQVSSTNEAEVAAPLELAVLGANGTDATLESWVCTGDATQRDATAWHSTMYTRTLGFSAKVPSDIGFAAIAVRSPQTNLMDGFACYEGFMLEELRTKWRGDTVPADADPQYEGWFLNTHRASARELELQRQATRSLAPSDVRFSIVVPLYRTPVPYLRELVASVLAQTYGAFELLLVNASANEAELCAELNRLSASDPRVRVLALPENLGIARNTLAGIHEATGDVICFADHDDVLEPDLLFCYASAIARNPSCDLLYCDEDKLLDGHFVNAFLKPDWNLDLLRSVNYVCHMLAVRASIVRQMPEEEYLACEGAQDHSLTLFAGEQARDICHVPRVLYHWRIHPESTAATGDAKAYATDAGVRAVQCNLDRCAVAGTAIARDDIPNTYRVSYDLTAHPLVSIVLPNKDQPDVLRRCVDSILRLTTYDPYEVVVVENNSTQAETFARYGELERNEHVRVVHMPSDGTFNFSRIVNYGAQAAKGDYLLFLNNDTEVITPDWIERMLGICQRADVGVVGAKLLYPDGLIQHGGVVFHRGGPRHISVKLDRFSQDYFHLPQLTQDLTAVTGACMLVARKTFDAVGGFDEEFPVDYNDVDFCLRVREQGLLVVYEPLVELYHHESVSRGGHESHRMKLSWTLATGRLMARWPTYFAIGDPYWHPNFFFNEYRRLFFWE